jgi:hypothetical protein
MREINERIIHVSETRFLRRVDGVNETKISHKNYLNEYGDSILNVRHNWILHPANETGEVIQGELKSDWQISRCLQPRQTKRHLIARIFTARYFRVASTSASNSGSPRFKFKLGDRLSD